MMTMCFTECKKLRKERASRPETITSGQILEEPTRIKAKGRQAIAKNGLVGFSLYIVRWYILKQYEARL